MDGYDPAMDASSTFDVAVAGRGAVGGALALGLAQQSLRVALIGPAGRRAATPHRWDLRVYAISRASMGLFERLRIARQLDWSRIAPVHDMRIEGDAARGTGRLHFSAYGARVPELAWVVEGRNLQSALDLGCEMQATLTLVDGEVGSYAVGERDVEVVLANGRSLRAALLVGADGAQSAIRVQAGVGGEAHGYGHSGVVTDFVCERPHGNCAYQWFRGDSVLALLPLPAHAGGPGPSAHVSMVWSVPTARADALMRMDASRLAAEVEQACAARLGALSAMESPAAFPLRYFIADTPVLPRLALVGDAAHLMHPLAGQGMNAGLLDAAALLDVVAAREPFRDLGDLRLLRRYARARAEDLRLMMSTTDGLKRLFQRTDPFSRFARNTGMNFLDRMPVLKNRLIRQAMG